MERSNNGDGSDLGPQPPPYNPQLYEGEPYSGVTYQVGKGNIQVVSPSGGYDNIAGAFGDQHVVNGGPAADYCSGPEERGFGDAAIRRGFIRKVYLTLMLQLLITVAIICAFLYWDPLTYWALDNIWFSSAMMPVTFVLLLILSCCDNLRRRTPLNFIALGLFTVAKGLMLGSVAVYYQAEEVLWAIGATALVSFSLSLFAMQSKWDFTAKGGCLWVLLWTFISFGLLCAIYRSQFLNIGLACLGTLLFSMYLVFDTHLILGGKHRRYSISPEEYVYAALSLYLDIVMLFLILLRCCRE